jgi:hypothetical protein
VNVATVAGGLFAPAAPVNVPLNVLSAWPFTFTVPLYGLLATPQSS